MICDIYFYTGTGNSLWAARTLAKEMGDAKINPISATAGRPVLSEAEAIRIVFPVYIWGPPRRVLSFVNSLKGNSARYYFAVAVNAGQVAATLLQLKKWMGLIGLDLAAGFGLTMPSNYIPWGGPGPEDEQIRRFEAAVRKIGEIASAVSSREKRPVEKGPLWQNVILTWFNRLSFPRIPAMDRHFWTDVKCDGCDVCRSVCPAGNIELRAGKPVWLHRCEQCLACIQWCPREAIQYGRKTARYEPYHHPGITLDDMIAAVTPLEGRNDRQWGRSGDF